MLEVVAYPPPRRWWQFWVPSRPVLLIRGIEFTVNADGSEVRIFQQRTGWRYALAYIHEN